MKMTKGPPVFIPMMVKCTGERGCESEMEDVTLSDIKRIHHNAVGQRDPAWEEVYINCMGCGKKIPITGLHPYIINQIPCDYSR